MEMSGTETFVGRDSYPAVGIVGMETRPIPVCIGGDSSPASDHGSPLKRTQTQTESVSTDLNALSRGFIPGEINRNVGYGNPTYSGLHRRGLKSRLRPWKSAQADSASDRVGFNRLACFEQGIYPRRNQWKCPVRKHLSGVIPIPPLVLSGMETRPIPVCIGGDSSPASDHGSPLKRTQPELVSTDLHALSRGFIPGEINGNVGMENRPTRHNFE